jgi:RHS repeat-associated protein
VTLPDGTLIEYVHDPLGRRIAKKVGGAVTEKYLWQGLTRLLAVYDGNDSLLMRFEYTDARMPVAMTKAGVRHYLAYDQTGTLKAVADASGNVVKRIEYDTFGNILSEQSTLPFEVPFGFAGGLYDKDTGLVRFGYRDYDPETGRWTAKDPILFAGGDTDLYGYCLNDPVNFADPWGLFTSSQKQSIVRAWTNIGAVVGATTGFLMGGGSGFLTGPGAVAAVPAGAYTGAATGAVIGGIAGNAIGNYLTTQSASSACSGSGRSPEYEGGELSEEEFLKQAEKYLGEDYREVSPGRYVSADGLRQVRFASHETRGANLHAHFEAYNHPGGSVIENTMVRIIP